MGNKNIEYKSQQIQDFFSSHRQKWEEFYPSERWVFNKIAGFRKTFGDILDVGCACGGLGAALSEKFIFDSYTGIDINKNAIEWARNNQKLSMPVKFIAGDILKQKLNKSYDVVASLSCADWNIETGKIINYCWDRVKPGGYFIISLRITKERGINDIRESYQHIDFSGKKSNCEIANYVVFNFKDVLGMIEGLKPSPQLVGAYGYWGLSPKTAVTLFKKLIFAVFYIQKRTPIIDREEQSIKTEFNLPIDIFL